MIVCEIGNIPPHSVPVVIREIMNEIDGEDEDEGIDDEDSSSVEEAAQGDNPFDNADEMREQEDE